MSTGNQHTRTLLICFGCFLAAFFLNMRIFNDGSPGWKQIVTSDGRGYYAYLPALLIDHDPSFLKVVERETRLVGYKQYKPGYLVKSGNKTFNKYFTGEALLLLPFFLTGTLFSWIFGTPVDGYSFFFQLFAGLGALFYLLLGFYFLARLLEHLTIRPGAALLAMFAIFFGTNLFYYAVWQPTMSHVFSFCLINGFLWFVMLSVREWNTRNACLAGLFLGLTILTRPTNLVVVMLVPFLAGNTEQLMLFCRSAMKKPRAALLFGLIFLGVVSVQMVSWYIQTGHILLWSYQGEGFRFTSPEIVNVLFSYRKGLFVYTPLILVSLGGLIVLALKNRLRFFSMVLFLFLAVYIIASWWNWYYGDGFGLRAFIDYYGIFAILLAMLMNGLRSKPALYAAFGLMLVFVVMNMIQTWQYTHMVIQPNSMNREKFQYIFMRTDSAVANSLGGNQEMANYDIDQVHPVKVLANDFEKPRENWSSLTTVKTSVASSGSQAGYLDSVHPFSSGISISMKQLAKVPSMLYVEGEVMVLDSLSGASNRCLVVLSMDSVRKGENWWYGFLLNDTPQKTVKKWRKCTFSLMTPEIENPTSILKIYIWTTGRKPVLIDDFLVRIYSRRQ